MTKPITMPNNLPAVLRRIRNCISDVPAQVVLEHFVHQAIESNRAQRAPDGWVLVPREIIDRFPEINPSNYDHDDACALNAWGVELVLAASPPPGEPAPATKTIGEEQDVQLDTDSDDTVAEQRRLMARAMALGQLLGNGKNEAAGNPELKREFDLVIKQIAKPIAEDAAGNCRSVPQLTFAPIFLGLKELFLLGEPAPEPQGVPEPCRPDILEKLSCYHVRERDDLTMDQCLSYLAEGWKKVRGRTERQLMLQLTAVLAASPPTGEPEHKPLFGEMIAQHEGLAEELAAIAAVENVIERCKLYNNRFYNFHEVAEKIVARLKERGMLAAPTGAQPAQPPIDMILYCPNCGEQHVDAPEDAECDGEVAQSSGWSNPPHRSHLCHECGTIWRPADVATNGVNEIKTAGNADTWPVWPQEVAAQPAIIVQPTQAAVDERAAFEAWLKRREGPHGDEPGYPGPRRFFHDEEAAAFEGWQARAALYPSQPQQERRPLTADDLREPKNGKEWRVEWWNESCRMMLPADMRLDAFQSYKNGTLQFTLKRHHGITSAPKEKP